MNPQRPLIDLLLRSPEALDAALEQPQAALSTTSRLLPLALGGLLAYGAVQGLLLTESRTAMWPTPVAGGIPLFSMGVVGLAYVGGFFGAQVAGLPSAWFYAALAGVRVPAARIAGEALRAQATSALVLLGLLPIYLAAGLGLTAIEHSGGMAALKTLVIGLFGFTLPFVAGLAGVIALYRAFGRILRAQAGEERAAGPLRLVLAWSVLFTAMAPVGTARLLSLLGDALPA
jgi:hypothetical protein